MPSLFAFWDSGRREVENRVLITKTTQRDFSQESTKTPRAFCIGQAISFLLHMSRKHQKHTAAAKLFHYFTLGAYIPWIFSISHFQQQLAVTQASSAQPGAGHPSPWQHRASYSTQSTAASIPEIAIHHRGKYKLLDPRAGFPEDSQGQALGNMLNLAPSSKCPNSKTFKF